MACKLAHINLKKIVLECSIVFLGIIYSTVVNGQSGKSGYNDVSRQRLLIRITAHYIHTISQGQIDIDSAIRIPCKVYHLSPLLAYNDGYSNGKSSVGTNLIDAGKLEEAKLLLKKLNHETRLRLLIELGSYYIFKPGNAKPDLDIASEYVNEAINLSKQESPQWKIETFTLKAYLLSQSGLLAESQKILNEAETLCMQSTDKLALARTLLNAGRLLPYGSQLRLSKFRKALSIFQACNNKEKEIETLSEINIENFVSKRYDLAAEVMHKIVKLQTEIGFRQQQYAYDALAYLAIRRGNLTEGLTYSNKSLECLSYKADSVFASFFYYRRGVLSLRLMKQEEALAWFNKSLQLKTKETRLYWYASFIAKVQVLDDLNNGKEALTLLKAVSNQFPPSTVFERMHFAALFGETYENLKEYRLAEENYGVFLAMAKHFPKEYIHDEFPTVFFEISTFYQKIGKEKKARNLLARGKAFISGPDMQRLGAYYYNLFKMDSTESRYLNAIKDLHLSHKFTDSAFSYDQRKKADELVVKYEADKKDKNIRLLNSQNQLERVKTLEANKTKNILIAGSTLLLIIIGLLYNRYVIKQRANRRLEASQSELDQKNSILETLNLQQQNLLKEKEWLIKEVHHRVKNNLQMVTGLLYSQSVYLEDYAAKVAVKDSLRRMQAMSLVHEKLYQDESTYSISMDGYINDLVHYLYESFDVGSHITFEQNIEPLDLDVSQAIPLALIINESIVNALKYAFLNEQKGIVRISLQRDGTEHLLLKLSDNGIGLPIGLDTKMHDSLGLGLMRGLTQQLKGEFNIKSDDGVQITVRFIAHMTGV